MNEIQKIYYSAKDIAEMLDVSKAKAYEIIRNLNDELNASGFITLQGKVPKAYFNKKWYGLNETQLVEGA
ncbi:ICEBs1 excisionase [Velocimicrobium porci]|uniref:TrmB family transcriptional regulator n=1 Tax=Velocimicrobium porci TaxID=2606634 RepID=A0A6L5XW10_9FIRM|nr:ICEBs1 excisionase [Velocimicrobium porci]MSS62789.1 TrmB family transcriptional regulator [Velocimicrobium porci]